MPLVVTPEEAAQILRVGRTKIYALMARGELQSVRIGKSRRIPYAAIEAFIESRTTGDAFALANA
jgi:excisionase family DNA binding protein